MGNQSSSKSIGGILIDDMVFGFKPIHCVTDEKLKTFKECIQLLKTHRNKKLAFINNAIPYNDEYMFYDYTNLILYYDGIKFYDFELNELKNHLILMNVFTDFVESSCDHIDWQTRNITKCSCEKYSESHFEGVKIDTTPKSNLINTYFTYFTNYCGINFLIQFQYAWNVGGLDIVSVEQVQDFIACLFILESNNIRYDYTGFSFKYEGQSIVTKLNVREHIQPILNELANNKNRWTHDIDM